MVGGAIPALVVLGSIRRQACTLAIQVCTVRVRFDCLVQY